ncbi:MAG: prolyl oligopeptidase family serine peptidase [Pseudomonadota bacterium]
MFRFVLLLLAFGLWVQVVQGEEDPYLWLEAIEGEESMDWVKQQNKRSLGVLTDDPRFKALEQEALEILTSDARIPLGSIRGKHVFNFWQDANSVRGILRRASIKSYASEKTVWETLLDVDALAKSEDENWVYQGYQCLGPKYELCYIRMSRGGTDASVYREYSLAEKRFLPKGFVLPEAKSSVQWIDEDHWLVGSNWGEGSLTDSGYARIVKLWKRGEPLVDAKVVLEGEATDVGLFANVYRDKNSVYPLVIRAIGFFDFEFHWLNGESVVKLPLPTKANLQGVLNGKLMLILNQEWLFEDVRFPQGAVVALDMSSQTPELVYAPTSRESVESVDVGGEAAYVELLDNVVGKVRRLELNKGKWQSTTLPLPDNGVVSIQSVNSETDDLLVSFESLTVPDSLYFVSGQESKKIKSLPAFYDAEDVVVDQKFATSKDGTKVPYFIMANREVLESGNAPTIQYGYGGFQAAILPVYYSDPARPQHGALAGRMWVSRGGVMVLSNIRGGSEFGPGWHSAALKENRQRAFDDFFAIAEHLIETGVTSPDKLGAIGRSNGGLLMSVALTQRPDLYAALDIGVPLADMRRYNKLLAGASWMGEYGNPDIPEEWAYIKEYSPYQRLLPDADYPEVFFYTSTKDDRVHPGHARKMAAKLSDQGHPFLYFENIEGGHGGTAK